MYRGHELPPVLPLRTTQKVPLTVQEDVEDTKIWSDYINLSLYWNAGWKKRTMPFCERMPFNFHDFLWIFQNLVSISLTFPGLKKYKGIPWLLKVFHDWIHPVHTPVDDELDRTVVSDTNINCTRVLFRSINTWVNTCILLVFYVVVVCLFHFNTNIPSKYIFHYLFWCPIGLSCSNYCPWV